ncbi:MAG: MBL fold metallo-hydrolase [Propionibacteriales bacterium]|nr:MBL fold metallo-hydrolase [Propionibacteriales bacterium]
MNTAHVEPGGSALVLPLSDDVRLTKFSVGRMDNNCYLLQHDDGSSILIDAAAEPGRIARVLGDRGPDVVITTHRHQDHVGALAAVAESRRPRTVAGDDDVAAIERQTGVAGTEPVQQGDLVTAGGLRLEVISLVGHTPGSIALVLDDRVLFSGDSLFPGGPGKTAGPAEFAILMDHLTERVFDRFGDDVVVHPGHGDSTTIGTERPHLDEWRARGW